MTESEWLTASEPSKLIASLFARMRGDRRLTNDERFRRFAIACCRRVAEVLEFSDTYALDCLEIYATSRLREALLKARRFHRSAANDARRPLSAVSRADGVIRLRDQARLLATSAVWICTKSRATQAAMAYCEAAAAMATIKAMKAPIPDAHRFDEWLVPDPAELAMQASCLRDIFGNPFHPLTLTPAHRTPFVVSLAQAAYEERHLPSGELDPHRLAVLADALEEVGALGELVAHLRSPGPHVCGCFPVDFCLGLS